MLDQKTIHKIIDDYVRFMVQIANDNRHGYSQKIRSLYNTSNPTSFDCSSLTLTAIQYAFEINGIKPTPRDINAASTKLDEGLSYTGNMLNLLKLGFEVVATKQTAHASLKKGDIELSLWDHVCVAVDQNAIVHARSSEGTSDTVDNSGGEIRTQPWYLYSKGWTHRLRFTGHNIEKSSVSVPVEQKVTAKEFALDAADYFDPSIAGTYICGASELNVRSGSGTGKDILYTIPKGQHVFNYGYYNLVNNTKWLLIQFVRDGKICTGFASEGANKTYLAKKAK